jgi:hypothetical protein
VQSLQNRPIQETAKRWGQLRKRDNLEDLIIDGRLLLKLIVKEIVAKVWTAAQNRDQW